MENRKLAVFLMVIIMGLFSGCSEVSHPKDKDTSSLATSQGASTLEMELMAYSYAISTFDEVTVKEIENKIEERDAFFLYVGRATCEWCRKLAPVLSQISTERNITIYYLDSTNTESDEDIKNFRETHGVKNVPAVLEFSSNGTYAILEYDLSHNRKDLANELNDLL